ncbi:MAG: hypothetical protein MI723_00550 [Caulobacterales bacterium]|nr:hypothetical protein [Caulobacterales bacterium]
MTVTEHDAISPASAAATAALVQVMALEHTLAALLEYVVRRDGPEAVEAIRDRAQQITQSVAERTDNQVVLDASPKTSQRIDALTALPLSLASAA